MATLTKIPAVAGLLDQLDAAERQALLAGAHTLRFRAGDTLLREGAHGSSMIVLGKGSVDVKRGDRVIATLGPGAAIGEMALLDPAPRSATVWARTEGEAWELSRDQLIGMAERAEPVAAKVLQALTALVCSRLGAVNGMVQDAVVKPKNENVWNRLWKSVSGFGR